MLRFPAFPAILLLSLAAPQGGRPSGQEPTPRFRVGVDVVPVDVSVLDDDGDPVLDLGRSDFTVLEDGVKQEIVHFSLEEFPTGSRTQSPPMTGTAETSAADALLHPPFRRFLIVLGRGGHDTFRPIRKLAEFVRSELGPEDEIAVTAYNRATDFTTDHEKIADLLDRFDELNPYVNRVVALRQSGLAAIYGSRKLPRSLQPLVDEIFSELPTETRQAAGPEDRVESGETSSSEDLMNGLRQEMLDPFDEVVRDFGRVAEAGGLSQPPFHYFDEIERKMLTDMPFEEYAQHRLETDQDLLDLFAGIEYLRYLTGEKHLLYFSSEGLFLPASGNRGSIARLASDARVRIHTFKTEGVFVRLGFKASFTREYAIDSLLDVSHQTGGNACIHRSVDEALATVGKASSHVYLLGYVPKNRLLNGSFRKIEVKVRRKGVRVLSRSGYFAGPRLQPYNREEMITYARISAALAFGDPIDDLPFSLSILRPRRENGSSRFTISLKISPKTAKAVAGSHDSPRKLVAGVFLLSATGEVLASSWKDIGLNFSAEGWSKFTSEGVFLKWEEKVGAKLDDNRLKLVLYDVSRDRVGSRVAKIR